jgi:hypothetical protein
VDLLLHLGEAADIGEGDLRLLWFQERRLIGLRALLPGLVADDREAHDVAGPGGRRVGEARGQLVAQLAVFERRIGGDRLVVGREAVAMLREGEVGARPHQEFLRAATRAVGERRRRIVDCQMDTAGEHAVGGRQRLRRHLAQVVGRLRRGAGIEQRAHQQQAQRQVVGADRKRLLQPVDRSAVHAAGVIKFRGT